MQAISLDRGWRIIIRFASTGFALGVVAEGAFLIGRPQDAVGYLPIAHVLYVVVVGLATLLSPGVWMFPEIAWSEAADGWFKLAFAAIANSVLYAILGALIAGLTSKSESNAANKGQ
jgi:hypothetical protein